MMARNDRSANEKHEPGEEQLTHLIKQAGEEARARKEKAFSNHFRMLKTVVAEGVSRRKHHNMQ